MYVECKNGAVLYILDIKQGRCEVVAQPLNGEVYKGKYITLEAVEREVVEGHGVSLHGGVHGEGFDVVRPVPDEILKVVNALYYVGIIIAVLSCVLIGAGIAWKVLP
jgi:hypothetical protein